MTKEEKKALKAQKKAERKANKKGVFKEFIDFINKGNALALAIGVIIGGAFSSIVGAINVSIISPIIACIMGPDSLADNEKLWTVLRWKEVLNEETGLYETVAGVYINWGAFIQAVIDFLLIAVILFAISKIVSGVVKRMVAMREALKAKAEKQQEEVVEEVVEEPAEPVIPEDVKLLQEIRDLLAAKNEK